MPEQDLVITEGVSGTWYYHLSRRSDVSRSLCGKAVMWSPTPLSTWGLPHVRERYCPTCERMAGVELRKALSNA